MFARLREICAARTDAYMRGAHEVFGYHDEFALSRA
jgi:hypothetical protein